MGVDRRTSAPVVLNSFTGCVRVSLCLACSKHFLSFQPVIYEENIFEEIVELKSLVLPAAHHYVQICFTNKTGCSGELSRFNIVWTCEFTLFLSPDHLPPASSLGRVLLPQLHLGPLPCGPRQQLSPREQLCPVLPQTLVVFATHIEKSLLPMPFLPQLPR